MMLVELRIKSGMARKSFRNLTADEAIEILQEFRIRELKNELESHLDSLCKECLK